MWCHLSERTATFWQHSEKQADMPPPAIVPQLVEQLAQTAFCRPSIFPQVGGEFVLACASLITTETTCRVRCHNRSKGRLGSGANFPKVQQREGIAAANERGVKFGRPAIELPPCFGEVIQRYRNREISLCTAASFYGMSPASFWRKSSGASDMSYSSY